MCGKVSFYEEARNPGNFDQKFYYQKQGIHGKVRSDDIQITDYKRNKLKDRLENAATRDGRTGWFSTCSDTPW